MHIPHTEFGKTGLNLPRIGLGLAALGRPGYINLGHAEDLAYDYVIEAMERRTHRMLDLAYELGIRYFDVARSYGRAESFLQSWLINNGHSPAELTVGSKWGYTYTADWKVETDVHEIKDHSLKVLQKQWEASKLLLPYLKLYQIHSATLESGVLENEEVLGHLGELKQKGIKIGLSVSGVDQPKIVELAMMIRVEGEHLFDSVQATYNILDQSMEKVLQAAAESGMGIIIKEALANGRLTNRNQAEAFQPKKQILNSIAQKYKVGIDAIALAFVLSRPWAHVVLSGAAVENHLRSNVRAASILLNSEEISVLEHLKMKQEDYWKERSKLKWN
jgi:aryl-alcohol dehydrogenase-like predicted oxidoreductase